MRLLLLLLVVDATDVVQIAGVHIQMPAAAEAAASATHPKKAALQPQQSVQLDDRVGLRQRHPAGELQPGLGLQAAVLLGGDQLLLGRHLGDLRGVASVR